MVSRPSSLLSSAFASRPIMVMISASIPFEMPRVERSVFTVFTEKVSSRSIATSAAPSGRFWRTIWRLPLHLIANLMLTRSASSAERYAMVSGISPRTIPRICPTENESPPSKLSTVGRSD